MRSRSEVCRGGSLKIHSTAIVHPDAVLGEGVEVGPFCIIAATVKIGARTIIGPRVSVEGHTTLGVDNEIFTGAVIGSRTQDKKFDGGISYVRIGDRNKIREYVTINPGTKAETETVIGNDNLLMAYAHIAHDCVVKNGTIIANAGTLAGHVTVEDGAILGGMSAVHQFVRIGTLALIGGCSKVVQDVPPFVIADGHPATVRGVNVIGLDRARFSAEEKATIKKAYRILLKSKLVVKQAIEKIKNDLPPSSSLETITHFLSVAERGICR